MSSPRIETSAEQFDLQALFDALVTHYQNQKQKLFYGKVEPDDLRNNLLKIALTDLIDHLTNTPENQAFFLHRITQLLIVNINQTKYYYRSQKNYLFFKMQENLGELHVACVNLLPVALINCLMYLRAKPIVKIIEYKSTLPKPHSIETKTPIYTKTTRRIPRILAPVEGYLIGISEAAKTTILNHPFFKLLQAEQTLENEFKLFDTLKIPQQEKTILLEVKKFFEHLIDDEWDSEIYRMVRDKILTHLKSLHGIAATQLQNFISYGDEMNKLLHTPLPTFTL
jgi:hypothetical protein